MKSQNTKLYLKDAKSDKQYNASLEKSGKLFVVNFAYGKRDGNLKEGTKTPTPVEYVKALAIYEKLVKSKTDKGYQVEKSKPTRRKTPKKSVKKPTEKTVKKSTTNKTEKVRDTKVLLKELKALIKSKKNPVAFLNTLTKSERNNLRPSAVELLPQKEEDLMNASLFERQIWYTFLLESHKEIFAANNSYFVSSLGRTEVFEDLLDHYQPDWLELNLEISYLEKIDYYKKGYMKSPLSLSKWSPNWELEDFIEAGRHHYNDTASNSSFFYRHKETLGEHIWLIFSSVSNIGLREDAWIRNFQFLIKKDKEVTRDKVMAYIQKFKTSDIKRKGSHNREYQITNWVYKLLRALEPSPEELLPMQDRLIENMSFPKIPFARNYSVEFLEVIAPEKEFKVKDCIETIANNIDSTKIELSLLIISLASAIHQHWSTHVKTLEEAMKKGLKNQRGSVREAVSSFLTEYY